MTSNNTSNVQSPHRFGKLQVGVESTARRDELIREYFPLVRKVVRRLMTRLPSCADFEELHSVGITGLLAAVDRYDAAQQITFGGYAQMRIRGAILDELRRLDSLPRSGRAKFRHLQEVVSELEQKNGRAPYDSEIAAAMGLSLPQLDTYRQRSQPVSIVSLDVGTTAGSEETAVNYHETIADERSDFAFERIERREMLNLIGSTIEDLPERQRDVLVMYYYEGLRLSDIAEVFGVTEARVCQIHAQALASMRRRMKQVA